MWKRKSIGKKGKYWFEVSNNWNIWGGWYLIPSIQLYFCFSGRKPLKKHWREYSSAIIFHFLGFQLGVYKRW